ncbi:MAG TPA: hypothetical protein VE866_01175, partial [Candidatus Binatia bacterium]|nr:hypothetical protein [Candidatus Binatia bacterium]
GKQFLLDAVYAGIDATHLYGRLDFAGKVPSQDFDLVVNVESWAAGEPRPRRAARVEAAVSAQKIHDWKIENGVADKILSSSAQTSEHAKLALLRNFEFKFPLSWMLATPGHSPAQQPAEHMSSSATLPLTSRLRLRFSLWQNRLPVDSLPLEGWIELQVVSEGELLFSA